MIQGHTCRRLQIFGVRYLSRTAVNRSGHNRWSKIKHDKAKEDAVVTKQRSTVAEELRHASRDYGPDPQMNSRLADVITKAKKIGFPKASIENAIARGQGFSVTGVALENVTVEAMIPPSVATIIECQTDSKARTLNEVRLVIKEAGGSVTATNHFFERIGKVTLESPSNIKETDIFDRAIEAGAIDVEIEEEGDLIITTNPSHITTVASTLTQSLGSKVKNSDIIWDPKEETMVDVSSSGDVSNFLGQE